MSADLDVRSSASISGPEGCWQKRIFHCSPTQDSLGDFLSPGKPASPPVLYEEVRVGGTVAAPKLETGSLHTGLYTPMASLASLACFMRK